MEGAATTTDTFTDTVAFSVSIFNTDPVQIASWVPTMSASGWAGFDVSITGYVAVNSINKTF